MDRRRLGLCFKCGQHWSPTHNCPDKHLRLLIFERKEPTEDELLAMEDKAEEESGEMLCQVLDYWALDSRELACSKTIKLEGALAGYPIVLLVDSGATHNFVAKELVVSLGLSISDTEEFYVGLSNGSKCASRGVCRGLEIKVGGYTMIIDAYVLDLGGVDIILGVAWLETCGQTTMDWKKKTTSFME